jgi:hypothetical protein
LHDTVIKEENTLPAAVDDANVLIRSTKDFYKETGIVLNPSFKKQKQHNHFKRK